MSAADGQRLARRQWFWPVATVVLGYLAGARWLHPLASRKGYYAGCYSFTDIELGSILTVLWLTAFAITLVPAPRRRAVALRLGTAVIAAILTVACCDLACTAWSIRFGHVLCGRHAFPKSTTQSDPELVFKHKPGIRWHGQKTPDCAVVDFRTDENGFRNPPGVRKADIVFIGDSVTEAGEVGEEATFVNQTARALGQQAVNLGVFCYGPQQELVVLKRYGLAYQPRTVVWQVTEWNDLANAEQYLRGDTDGWKIMKWKELYERHSPVVQMMAQVFPVTRRHTVEFILSDGTVDRRVIWPYFDPVPACPVGLRETLRVLTEARALCRERGIEFLVLLVPPHERILAPYVKARSVEEARQHSVPGDPRAPSNLARVLADFCQTQGCGFVDVADEFRRQAAKDNRNLYIRDDTHLGADAHAIVARALTRRLETPAAVARGEADTTTR